MLDAEALKELEDKYGEIARVRGKGGSWEVVFRPPTQAEYKMFKAHLRDPRYAPDAQEVLSIQCVVYPSKEEYAALLKKKPAVPEACSEAFMDLVGLNVEATGK
jgi:hypothetical protein